MSCGHNHHQKVQIEKIQIKEISEELELFIKEENKKNKQAQQQNCTKYKEFFNEIKQKNTKSFNDIDSIEKMHRKLRQNGFNIHESAISEKNNLFKNKFKIKRIQIRTIPKSRSYEVVQLECRLGIYQKSFLLLNLIEESSVHQMRGYAYGTLGNIYKIQINHQEIAIKCLKRKTELDQNQDLIFIGISEYFILCMMSALQIGPKVKQYAGFDLIITKNCIQFSMQLCTPMQEIQVTRQMQIDLKKSLQKMHLLKLMHLDIKPSNVMFSNQFSKAVFIDFGLSEIIDESFGQKTFTSFLGTVEYCSEQMHQCLRSTNFVDLYFNDVNCLINTFQVYQKNNQNKKQKKFNLIKEQVLNDQDQSIKAVSKQIEFYLIKFYLIKEEFEYFLQKIQQLKEKNALPKQLQQNIFHFFLHELPFSKQFWQCLNKYIIFMRQKSEKMNKLLKFYNENRKFNELEYFQIQTTNFNFFEKLYKNLENTDNLRHSLVYKQKVKQILQSSQLSIQDDIYFTLFLKFISFCNNIFETDLNEKYGAVQCFFNYHKHKFIQEQQTKTFLKKYSKLVSKEFRLSNKLKFILESLKICLAIVQVKRQIKQFGDLLMDIVKQIYLIGDGFEYEQFQLFCFNLTVRQQPNVSVKLRNWVSIFSSLEFIRNQKLKYVYDQNKKQLFYPLMKSLLKEQLQKIYLKFQKKQFESNFYYEIIGLLLQKFQIFYQITHHNQNVYIFVNQLSNIYQNERLFFTSSQNDSIIQIIGILILHLQAANPNFEYSQKIQGILLNYLRVQFKKLLWKNQKNILQSKISTTMNFWFKLQLYQKSKNQLVFFDHIINCQEISNNFFISQRLKIAYAFLNAQQIEKIVQIIYDQSTINFYNKAIYQKLFVSICFIYLTPENKIGLSQQKIKKWLKITFIFYLQKYQSNFLKQQNSQILQNFLFEILHMSQSYLALNVNQKNQQLEILNKINLMRNKIILKNQYYRASIQYQFYYCNKIYTLKSEKKNILIQYATQFISAIESLSDFNMNCFSLDNILKEFRYLKDFLHQKLQIPKIKYQNQTILQYALIQQGWLHTPQSFSKTMKNCFLGLLNIQAYNQLVKFILRVINYIKSFNIIRYIKEYQIQVLQFYKTIWRQSNIKIHKIPAKLYVLHLTLLGLVLDKQLYPWQDAYISLILIQNLYIFRQTLKNQKKMLLFIAKTLKYLNLDVRQNLLQYYYLVFLDLCKKQNQYDFIVRLYYKKNRKIYLISQYHKFYLRKIKKKGKNNIVFVNYFKKKIERFHKVLQNIQVQQNPTKKNQTIPQDRHDQIQQKLDKLQYKKYLSLLLRIERLYAKMRQFFPSQPYQRQIYNLQKLKKDLLVITQSS